jgi:transcriptional regulator with XRE-family HTH domain
MDSKVASAITMDDYEWDDAAATFGDRLALAREHAGMDQAQLARRLGVKLVTMQNWEADRAEPRANKLQMLAGLLNVSMIWLMTGGGAGGPMPGDGIGEAGSADLRELLTELREMRRLQGRLAERTGLIEKRLRGLAGSL